ncbi:MAG: hypothetical protein HRU41_28505 [Saprospiraceae bacterium]|nr:hypothetical protein [Saprospiraceae bacterium]
MTPKRNFTRLKTSARHTLVAIGAAGALFFTSCDNVQYVEEEKVELTKGLITTLEEVEPDNFKIIDEQVVDSKAQSRVITHYMDGTIDTLMLNDVDPNTLASTAEPSDSTDRHHYYRRRSMSGVLMGGLMGYYMGRSTSVPPSASSYRDQNTYNRVNSSTGRTLSNTASRTTVRKPTSGSSGFGGSRSTRSSGG